MSESGTETSGSSFSSSTGGGSIASDNTDTRALDNMQEGPEGEDAGDLGTNNKSIQEGLFATLYTLTKNRTMDQSLRVAGLRVLLEFLFFFRIAFNFGFPWTIDRQLWIFKAVEWLLLRSLIVFKGYDTYIEVFYIIAGVVFATVLLTVWVAVVLKGSDSVNPWLKRLIGLLQLLALVIFCIIWPILLDYVAGIFCCSWANISQGLPATHIYFPDQNCTAMPHLAHMILAGVTIVLLAVMVMLMGMATCDFNPLNISRLSSSDEVATIKMLLLKIIFVLVATALNTIGNIQPAIMAIVMWGVVYYMFDGVPFYSKVVNIIWGGLWMANLNVVIILLVLSVTRDSAADPAAYSAILTNIMLFTIFPAVAVGMALMWLRLKQIGRLAKTLHNSFNVCKAAVLANTVDEQTRQSGSVVALMTDLKKVHRWRDVRQVTLMCREMRVWDEDGLPEAEAFEFGEFVMKCGMARMGNNPALLTMYSNFLIEARKDGQAARTQLQLAQKANPSVLDNYNIYVAQQIAKQLKRDGDGLDLLSYVEFQRNYMACVRQHKAALLTQRAFWNSLLRDTISFRDLQANVQAMDAAEERATSVYRRVMERYPGNGKVMKVYGRFLEYVRTEPGSAARYYDAAVKAGTSESLLALTSAEGGAAGLAAAGPIDEKTDGLVVINAQGIIMMMNAAAVTMFGYQKGELEGKNVSVLMPPGFGSRHDSFMQRYLETGVTHIMGRTRPVVALHKERSMFPINLTVARLSGVGTDTLFIGVLKRDIPVATATEQVVKFWTTASGIILCAESCMTDVLGNPAGDVVGRSFSNLCTDVEGVNTFINSAAKAPEEDSTGAALAAPTYRTKMLHAFMPAVDVEVTAQFGGSTEVGSDYRSIALCVRVLTEASAVMVVDHKGRILHATGKLSNLLGHPVAALVKMELNALIPQPICQMHGSWFKDPPGKIPATSCRAGGVVHLLAANGTKVPVTLKMSQKEDVATGHMTHVVQVSKASEEQRLDHQRLMLGVNHKGIILTVNQGVSKTMFGFEGQQLVGQPLSSVIDIFTDWKEGHDGDEMSLLELLVEQLMAATLDPPAGQTTAARGCDCWRVGVHRPVAADPHTELDGHHGTNGSSLLQALQPNRIQPACMKLEPVAKEPGDLLVDEQAADTTPVLQVALYRSDAITAVIDLDKDLKVARADDFAGLMFGVAGRQLLHHSFPKLIGLSGVKHFDDLLGKSGTAKKGAMKQTAAASRAGAIRRVTATHLGDGQPLTLNMQAMSYDQSGKSRRMVRLQLVSPVSAAMEHILAIQEGSAAAVHTGHAGADEDGEAVHRAGSLRSAGSSSSGKGSDHGADLAAEPSGVEEAPAPGGKKDRIHDWVRQASHLERFDDEEPDEVSPRHKQQSKFGRGRFIQDGDAEVAVHIPGLSKSPGSKGKFADAYSDDDGDAPMMPSRGLPSLQGRPSDGAGSDAAESFVGSMADGMSDIGSGIDSAVSAGAMGHEEELAVDTRRVKRLKKLSRMFSSSIAQAATNQWKKHTVVLLVIALVAHIVCFAVISTQLDARHANANSVNNIALSMSSASQAVLRINFLHKCFLPQYANFYVCEPQLMEDYGTRLAARTALFRTYHQSLYLGGNGLKPFSDERLINFWTYQPLPETLYYQHMPDGQPAFANSTRTLWEIGNVLTTMLDDVYFYRNVWGATMDGQPQWQYAFINGPGSLFTGYAWSLDTFTDYTWQDLTRLSTTLIVLLVVEAVVVLMACLAYEFYLLQKCNVANMRSFAVFLALPSATVRFMVRKPMIIDDSSNDDVDDDDLDLAEGAAGGQTATGGDGANAAGDGDAPQKEKKSVRLAAADDDGDGDGKKKKKEPGSGSGKVKGKHASAKKKPPLTRFAAFKKKVNKQLFGWMDPKFKQNGKKLSPSNRIIWSFMLPMLLWVAAVVIIFGVSYSDLQGLQGPLASLDLAAHVTYRLTRCRLVANMLAFTADTSGNAQYRAELKSELDLLREEYRTLLYGGHMRLQAEVTFNAVAPAAVFDNPAVSDIFFKTTDCLRADQSKCLPKDNEYYQLTHSGLDAQIQRYMDEMTLFSNVPDELAYANHTAYEFTSKVTSGDTYDGLQQASDLFVGGTLVKLDGVKQLHIILLVISLACMTLFVIMLYRPYIKALKRDTKAVVNMLSQLPAEVDVEGQVKSIVLGITKTDGSKSMEGLQAGAMQPFGMAPPGMRGGWGMGAGPQGAGGGWFGRGNNGPQAQGNDPRMYGYGMHNGMGMPPYGGPGSDMA